MDFEAYYNLYYSFMHIYLYTNSKELFIQ